LATQLSRGAQFWIQLKGVFWVGLFTFVGTYLLWQVVRLVIGVRVSPEEEQEGLDIGEHGNEAYPNFQPVAER